MREKYVIEGGSPLSGTIQISGAKNAVLKMIPAAILTDQKVILKNVPRISDVDTILAAVATLGVRSKWRAKHTLELDASNVTSHKVPLEIVSKMRASFVILGPLLSRFKKAIIANPGGCRIGARPVNRHIEAIEKLGAKVDYTEGYYHINGSSLHEAEVCFEKRTHTGTENLILSSVLTIGKTVVNNAAAEPEIDDLITMLNLMGAKIKRVEERKIEIDGVEKLGGVTYEIMPDRNEAVTFAVAAGVTGGKLFLKGIESKHLLSFLNKASQVGLEYQSSDKGIHFWRNHNKEFKPIDLETGVHPGFMTDWQPPFALLLSQASGVSTIHETVMDKRFGYIDELKNMGFEVESFNPEGFDVSRYNFNTEDNEGFHAIAITGPVKLKGATLEIPDLRAGATLILAALMAEGISELYGIQHVERGYEDLEERLYKVGAKIKKIIEK